MYYIMFFTIIKIIIIVNKFKEHNIIYKYLFAYLFVYEIIAIRTDTYFLLAEKKLPRLFKSCTIIRP